jgi:hypothetical protein
MRWAHGMSSLQHRLNLPGSSWTSVTNSSRDQGKSTRVTRITLTLSEETREKPERLRPRYPAALTISRAALY